MAAPAVIDARLELALQVCHLIAEGDSVQAACSSLGTTTRSFMRWLRVSDELCQQYVRARQTRCDARFERIDQVLLDMRAGKIDSNQARVEIDTIKWQCWKEAPNKYGDRMDFSATITWDGDISKLPPAALDKLIQALEAQAAARALPPAIPATCEPSDAAPGAAAALPPGADPPQGE